MPTAYEQPTLSASFYYQDPSVWNKSPFYLFANALSSAHHTVLPTTHVTLDGKAAT